MSDDKDIISKVEKWINEEGYPLEMKVANAFRANGFEVLQSYYYQDPENNTLREIDMVAIAPEFTGITNIRFVVECKSSKKKPWVLFSSEHTLVNFNRLFSYCVNSDEARSALIDMGIDEFMDLPWMRKSSRIIYGLTQAFTNGPDATYTASTSVLKSAISIKRDLKNKRYSDFIFIFPVIVFEGTIFECYMGNDGRLSLQEFERGDYFFRVEIDGEVGTCIHILNSKCLSEFAKEAKNVANSLISLLKEKAQQKLKNI